MKTLIALFGSIILFVVPIRATERYVDLNNTNAASPFTDWSTAATNIQDAINISSSGDLIWVTNGIYATSGKSMDGIITNRVSLDKTITVQSVSGPDVTIIQGNWDPTSVTGAGAVRCAWLTNNATLSGFTLRSGATRAYSGSGNFSMYGGGVWGSSTSATVSNCIITANFAGIRGEARIA